MQKKQTVKYITYRDLKAIFGFATVGFIRFAMKAKSQNEGDSEVRGKNINYVQT